MTKTQRLALENLRDELKGADVRGAAEAKEGKRVVDLSQSDAVPIGESYYT